MSGKTLYEYGYEVVAEAYGPLKPSSFGMDGPYLLRWLWCLPSADGMVTQALVLCLK